MALRQEGNDHFNAGRLEEAMKAYTRALEAKEQDRHLILANRSRVCLKLDDFEGALADAKAAVAEDRSEGTWPKGHYLLAQALENHHCYREAWEAAEEALRRAPSDAAVKRLVKSLEPLRNSVTEAEVDAVMGAALSQYQKAGTWGGPTISGDDSNKFQQRLKYAKAFATDPFIVEQVFGLYAAPADICTSGWDCKAKESWEVGQVWFFKFPKDPQAFYQWLITGQCIQCLNEKRKTQASVSSSSVPGSGASSVSSKTVEAVIVTKRAFVLRQTTVDLTKLERDVAAGRLERFPCEIANTLLGLDIDLYTEPFSQEREWAGGHSNQSATFLAARYNGGFAPNTVLGEATMVRRSGKPLPVKAGHNILLLTTEAMDLYGDDDTYERLRGKARAMLGTYKRLTGKASPTIDELVEQMGRFYYDMEREEIYKAVSELSL